MAHGRSARLLLLVGCLGTALLACRPEPGSDLEQWRAANRQWQTGDPHAYEAWRRLDARGLYGRAAHGRLVQADREYRHALELMRSEQPGVRETLAGALALAPMDPALYLLFARACRERGYLVRAAELYRKFLARNAGSPDGEAARAELATLSGPSDPPDLEPPPGDGREDRLARLAGITAGALLVVILLTLVARRRRGHALRELLRDRPEVHQTVAYCIGCLRHEFLKHRIGAAGEALAALADGRASDEQRRFLEERLCRGEPLLLAWRAHLRELERAVGAGASLGRTDPLFRAAQRSLLLLERTAGQGRAAKPARVRQALDRLLHFDHELGEIVVGLAHCPVDQGFLADVVAATRAEWSSGKVELDEVIVGPAPDGVAVDVYLTDLRIVLKNILRNAIAALSTSPRPRRLAVDVQLALEPTGEEIVRIRVRDSSVGVVASLSRAAPSPVEHGLGIVQTALLRYDGSLDVTATDGGFAKAVVVRLFRSQVLPRTVGAAA